MENYARDLEKRVMEAGPFENNFSKRSRTWEILFVGDDGKVVAIPWLKKLFITISFVCVCFLIFLSIMFVLYGFSMNKNKVLVADLNQSRVENSALKKDVERLKIILASVDPEALPETPPPMDLKKTMPPENLDSVEKKEAGAGAEEDKIKLSVPDKKSEKIEPVKKIAAPEKDKSEPEPVVIKKEKIVPQPVEKAAAITISENEEEDAATDDVMEPPFTNDVASQTVRIDIEDFTASRKVTNDSIRIRFIIKNMSNNSDPVSGNIFAVLKSEVNDPEDWIVVPVVKIVEGKPTQPRRGQFFSIRKFKPVRFIITNRSDYEKYKEVTVFIFTRTGELVTEKTFPLKL